MFAFQALKMLPAHILFIEGELFGIIFFSIGGAIWALVPWLDRKSSRGIRSKVYYAFGWLVLAFMIGMTIYGYLVE